MTTYVPVRPGINMKGRLGGDRLTKKFVREIMREHPEWDWRNLGPGGAYVNGEDAVRYDLILQVYADDLATTLCMVHFQADQTKPFGYQAVVS